MKLQASCQQELQGRVRAPIRESRLSRGEPDARFGGGAAEASGRFAGSYHVTRS
jgi:hypothetical protein